MTGSQLLTNCRCLAFEDFSATRNTTKLAGTKDMATMMKMAITTSVPWSLQIQDGRGNYYLNYKGANIDIVEKFTSSPMRGWRWFDSLDGLSVWYLQNTQKIQNQELTHSFITPSTKWHVLTIGSRVAFGWRQVGTQDGIVEDVEICWHAVVSFIVVQNLKKSRLLH